MSDQGITVDQFFYGIYADAGLITLEQTGLSPDQTEECRRLFNRKIDAWALDGWTIFWVKRTLFDISPNQGDYTVGPGGDWDNPVSPVRCERASMIITTVPSPSGPPEYPIFPLTIDEWQSWILKKQATTWPRRYYFEPCFPLPIMHILWVPQDANQIALYLEQPLTQIDATGDALLIFRPGFEIALSSNLAVELAARKNKEVAPRIAEIARESLNLIKMANDRPLSRVSDIQQITRWRSNVYSGNRYSQT